MTGRRVDVASRLVGAAPAAVYGAFVSPEALVCWLPPASMSARIETFEPWPGGRYRMTLRYEGATSAAHGKTTADADVVHGRFVELIPDQRIVQSVTFATEDPAFVGEMTMIWSLAAAAEGTLVTVRCENVPSGISSEDHRMGLESSLENLAAYLERPKSLV